MASIVPGLEYDIFISYRHNDNLDGWVTDFVQNLEKELRSTIKDTLTIYFDKNPHNGLLETHNVDKSLEGKLKCLIFIPIISQTYCDTKSFAWQHEFVAFNKLSKEDPFGRDIKLSNGNVASRILPIKIHDLDADDKSLLESELSGVLRAIEFNFKSSGVNRPLTSVDKREENSNKTLYRDQVNKVANAIKEIVTALRNPIAESPRTTNNLPTGQEGDQRSTTLPKNKKALIASFALLLLVIISYFLYQQRSTNNQQPTQLEKSIAVLPFGNLSNDPEQEYFSDGLTEEITERLTKISGLRVIPSTSMMEYKKTNKNVTQIATDVNVSYILEGRVRKSENGLRLNVRLIDAKRNQHIWSETLDRPLTETLQVQSDIATQIANFLQITLTENDKGHLSYIPTMFISAYDYYLRAAELSAQRSLENDKAIELLKEAIKIDPKFVEAWATLGFRFAKKGDDLEEGENWLDSALYYTSKALAISPTSTIANLYKGFTLMYQNRLDEASIFLKKSNSLDPKMALRPLSTIQLLNGRLDSAYYYANKLIYLDPEYSGSGYSQKVRIFKRLGQWDSCQINATRSLLTNTKTGRDISILEYVNFYIKSGEYNQAIKLINENYVNELDPARVKEKNIFIKTIYALQGDWISLSKNITESDLEGQALMHKKTKNKIEFEKDILKLKSSNPESEHYLLLIENFKPLLNQIETLSTYKRYSDYQFWLSNPFAQEFINTPEFKELFSGYDEWVNQMMFRIGEMNQHNNKNN